MTKSGNLNLGMNQLITRERERLGVNFVCDDEIWEDEFTARAGYEGYEHFTSKRGYALLAHTENSPMVPQTTITLYPTEEKRAAVCESGFEFTSIMKLAALSIGTSAVYGKLSFSDLTDFFPPSGTDLFWQNVIQSWSFLGMASDRLRTFFIEFVLCEPEKNLNKKLKKKCPKELDKSKQTVHKQYVYIKAFHESITRRLSSELSQQRLSELQGLLEKIAAIRLKRNSFIHDYASREAMIFAAEREESKDHAEVLKAFKGDKQASDYINELTEAYKVLAQAGNLVFLLEKDVELRASA
ncbi:MAG: hypothetical protein ABL919_02600 [Methylococcales bacterium]|nr:hypothetical protein [Methylococcaceae bacterium]